MFSFRWIKPFPLVLCIKKNSHSVKNCGNLGYYAAHAGSFEITSSSEYLTNFNVELTVAAPDHSLLPGGVLLAIGMFHLVLFVSYCSADNSSRPVHTDSVVRFDDRMWFTLACAEYYSTKSSPKPLVLSVLMVSKATGLRQDVEQISFLNCSSINKMTPSLVVCYISFIARVWANISCG